MQTLRRKHRNEIKNLSEYIARRKIVDFLNRHICLDSSIDEVRCDYTSKFSHVPSSKFPEYDSKNVPRRNKQDVHTPSHGDIRLTLQASILTFLIHVESRIASLVNEGYYTIGPCGEEILSAAALALEDGDAVALHYRHVGISILRRLKSNGGRRDLSCICLDRARGHVVSRFDPVTGGVHCAIGGGDGDYVVTSTLASQCPPAVGRALGFSLKRSLLPPCGESGDDGRTDDRPVSFVTIGDGSMANAHFLSALNLAKYARHRTMKCPVVFGISDNDISISLKGQGYARSLLLPDNEMMASKKSSTHVPVFHADGNCMLDVYDQTLQATDYARKHSAPAIVLYSNLTRRFGHAATDRQSAYLTNGEIQTAADTDVILHNAIRALELGAMGSVREVRDLFVSLQEIAERAFDTAVEEPKISARKEMIDRASPPPIPVSKLSDSLLRVPHDIRNPRQPPPSPSIQKTNTKPQVMRKLMTKVLSESLTRDPSLLYVGEDVRHGGYYLVTHGLADQFPSRVQDFPPDETTLIGSALGYAQCGFTPIVEIPYAKYLDCGLDMFHEVAIDHWLNSNNHNNHNNNNGTTTKTTTNGMVFRLQGFDKGKFGGNFHTHNMLHMPPGVDVVCYSNGEDYVRGMRNAILQASQGGRKVMLVDCTYLLNLKHLYQQGDCAWERYYPEDTTEIMGFHDVRRYHGRKNAGGDRQKKVAIVSYGNGVVTSLRARKQLLDSSGGERQPIDIDVIDCPYISHVPNGLREIIPNYDHVIFADICKEGSNPMSAMVARLQKMACLPKSWQCVAAPTTYNPLGNDTLTFLNEEDIIEAYHVLI
eukprot:CAMPEP_0195522446 /NCGR_PEP_ID=MMETSP0794_2-20130614/20624_1 /TAXON_ID=515487 /ORGANISM="Stephanopyxis turris, Strain CCMP 815" /LENGTH=822 /DNA_ID=CAMNT_0040652207 /DNA_START=461 /DNA_END=2929 /DNA_ORIENTATION=+